mmetsp:Transcript_11308/g.24921  ORF Transcript_11308/g.24921 Transcript_11308/m.24921 type:complete len:504 (-) Transcript_11308:296-1807(-)|eukprot:CAMPEP_0206458428 /NCGR_PEP_ID=MMETSP0324_2-20121206/23563_1 /ASSEMBLY_ACC=CAM_ASM_000836 /TAXON_ID=2866 /ORGANISM="Crypthecodinium cohnii, Strain Seligo" /LENGTH=503 /DNA_ID=CAMNT_0053929763 /DNA_START=10 /DNA_END=1521 /DNA_ORIENTATION=+
MSPSLVSIEREHLSGVAEDGLQFTLNEVFAKDNHYTLFRWEDWPAWLTFTLVFAALIALDNFVMNRNLKSLTLKTATLYTLFWIGCACCCYGWVCLYFGPEKGFMWMSGYMLEWMLSFDNLFVFHLIFSVYNTPCHLKHRPLYLGICGAVVFRLAFLFVGEYLMHAMFLMHFVFGSFLVYTGVKTATVDEEDEDPSKHPAIVWLQKKVPLAPLYDDEGRFFVEVVEDADGREIVTASGSKADTVKQTNADLVEGGHCCSQYGSVEEGPTSRSSGSGSSSSFTTTSPSASSSSSCYGSSSSHPNSSSNPRASDRPSPSYCSNNNKNSHSSKEPAGSRRLRTPPTAKPAKRQLRATMLFLVLICLELSDLLFAVDSVSAIVAQVNDLFLAYSSAVFAMLGLRAMFFIVDELAKIFALLKYGVAAVLVFIGFKLMLAHVYRIPAAMVCGILVSVLALSILASVAQERVSEWANYEKLIFSSKTPTGEKVLTPLQSPYPPEKRPRMI